MKTVFARISMELEITNAEYELFLKKANEYEHGISDELAKRFLEDGKLSDDSYIPNLLDVDTF